MLGTAKDFGDGDSNRGKPCCGSLYSGWQRQTVNISMKLGSHKCYGGK